MILPHPSVVPGSDVFVALDVGTSGARAVVFDLAGQRWREFRRPYPTVSPRPGWAEQDPVAWRRGALGALAEAVAAIGPDRRIVSIGLTGQCPTVVGVDARGRPVGSALIYRDNRAQDEAAWLTEQLGPLWIHQRTGHIPTPFHIAPKLLWLRAHDRARYDATETFLQPRDLICLILTGELATDGTHAPATLLFDIRSNRWDGTLLDTVQLDERRLPPIRGSAEVVGAIRPLMRRRLGLRESVPVVLGGADSQACAFGAGVVGEGPISEMAGSSTCLNSAVPAPLPALDITHYRHVVGSGFTTETGINTTGAAVAWLADLVYGGRSARARSVDYARLDRDVASVAPGSDDVLALVVFGDGERSAPDLRAAFTGLSVRHTRPHLARALLEGVAFAIRAQVEDLRTAGVPVTELRVSGGDARLRSWNQIKADVLGVPVATIAGDATVTGTAMLAGLGTGFYRDVAAALEVGVHVAERFDPNAAAQPILEDRYRAWRRLARSALVTRATRRPARP